MLDLRPEQMQEYVKKITSMAQSAGCKVCYNIARMLALSPIEPL